MRKNSFPPVGAVRPEILILGSMPGEASLAAEQYYAHPRNAFWPIMGALFGAGENLSYADRLTILARHKIAVWDTLASCIREGSLDTSILEEQPNDFSNFIGPKSPLEFIFFNGAKAEKSFRKLVLPKISYSGKMELLPSTSPAHAGLSLQDKAEIWKKSFEKYRLIHSDSII